MILSNFRGLAVAAIVGVSLFASATSAAAAPTIVVVNSIAALGANGATITFDGVSDTIFVEATHRTMVKRPFGEPEVREAIGETPKTASAIPLVLNRLAKE